MLQATIIDRYEQEPDVDPTTLLEVTAAVEELNDMVSEIDDAFRPARRGHQSEPGNARSAVISKTTKLADAYLSLVDSDPDFALIDDNEFYQTGLKSFIKDVLIRISNELQPLT